MQGYVRAQDLSPFLPGSHAEPCPRPNRTLYDRLCNCMLKFFTGLGVQKCKQALDRFSYLILVSKAYYTASTDIIIELLQGLSTVLSIFLSIVLRPQGKSGRKVD